MPATDLLGQLCRLLALEQAGRILPEAAPGGFLADPDPGGAGLPPTDPAQVDAMVVGLLEGAGDDEIAAALAQAAKGSREAAWLADEAARRGSAEQDGPHYRLHYFPESGNSYKLALMLSLCGRTFEGAWTDFGARVTWTPEWRATVNPMGEVPVLEEDGVKLTQTAPILLRLAERYGRYGATDEAERFELLRWLFWDNQKLSGATATYRFLRTFTRSPDPAVLRWHLARVMDFLGVLDAHLATRPFLLGERATVADLSACAYLSYPEDETGFDLPVTHPAVRAWLDRVAALPGWAAPYDLLPGARLPRYA